MSFLKLLYEDGEGWLTIWTLPDKRTYWFDIETQLDDASRLVDKIKSTHDVYYGVGLRSQKVAGRGGNDDVCAIPGLWVDIDIAAPAHKANDLPPNVEAVTQHLQSFPLEPTLLVHSGNGIHAYWLFKELWKFDDAEERQKATDILERFQAAIRQLWSAQGWKLDPTHDLARVLRIPGTLNHKSDPPKQVRTIHQSDRYYNLSDFEPYLPELEANPNTNNTTFIPQGEMGPATLIVENCKFIQYCKDNAATLSEPEWYAMVTNVARAQDGAKLVHELSRPYPKYNPDETNAKIRHALDNGQPHTCIFMQETLGFACPPGGCGVKAPCAFALSRTARAKATIKQLDPEKIDVKTAYSPEVLGALATLKEVDPAEYALSKEFFRGKVNLNDLERAVNKEATRQRLRVIEAEESAPREPLEKIIEDVPIGGLYGPPGWTINENGLWSIKVTKDGPLEICACMSPVVLTKRLRNIETGEERVELTYKRDGKWRFITADRATVANRQGLVSLANRGLPVNSENARYLIQFLDELERENRDAIPVVRSIGRMGWIGTGYKTFLPGMADDVELDIDETSGAAATAAAYRVEGTLEQWVKYMTPLRAKYPIARLMLAGSFAAPLLSLVGQRVFIVHAWGPSRGGKTAALKAALSVWGEADELIASFNATRVGLERLASFYSDLPLGVDERQVVGDRQGFVEGLIYMLGSGRGRVRGSKGGGIQQIQSWRTVVLTTGEQPLSTDGSNAGIKTRTLELYGTPIGDEQAASMLHDLTRSAYGSAGPVFVRRLIETLDEDPEAVKGEFEALKKALTEQYPQNASSHVQAVACLALADFLSSMWVFGIDEEEAATQAVELASTALEQLETAVETDDGKRAYDFFLSWYKINKAYFDESMPQVYGRVSVDGDVVLVHPPIFEKAIQEGGYNPQRILRDWADRGWLELQGSSDGKRRLRVKRRDADGKLAYFVAVRLPSEEPPSDDDDVF